MSDDNKSEQEGCEKKMANHEPLNHVRNIFRLRDLRQTSFMIYMRW